MYNAKVMAAALAVSLAAPVAAAPTFTVNIGSVAAIPGSNDYQSNLSGLGLVNYASAGSSVSLSAKALIKFEFLGSESGFTDNFKAGSIFFQQIDDANRFVSPASIGSAVFDAGAFLATFHGQGLKSDVGSEGFGIFLPTGFASGGSFTSSVLYFGYDNQPSDPDDDNHDDLIIRATVVPEPAMLGLLALGVLGVAAIRRRSV